VKPWCLLARLGGIGDNLIASSVLPLLAETHHVEVMAQRPQHVIFEGNPYISKLTVRAPGDLPADGNHWQAWFAHRGREYDKWFNLSHSCEGMLALLPGQTQFNWPAAWRRKYCGVNYLEFVHDIVGVRHEFNPRFYPTDEEQDRAAKTLAHVRGAGGYRHVVGIVLAGSRLDKMWPYLPLLVAKLVRELRVAVVMFGGDSEAKIAKRVHARGAVDRSGASVLADPPIARDLAALRSGDHPRHRAGLGRGDGSAAEDHAAEPRLAGEHHQALAQHDDLAR
jgi:ADP-heptose:LPS heptosyltransferase